MPLRIPLQLAIFIVWLLAFPMKGFLLAHTGLESAFPLFVVLHATALFATSYLVRTRVFPMIVNIAIIVTITGTALFPYAGKHALPLLALLAVTSSCLLVKAMGVLSSAANPPLAAALSLVCGNLALLVLMKLPLSPTAVHLLLALLLLIPLFSATPLCGAKESKSFAWYLPFLFVYHLISGLMYYGTLIGAYSRYAFIDGVELLFYIGAAVGGAYVVCKGRDILLILGIIGGMLSFSLFQVGGALPVNLSMFAIQAAEGFVDLFVLVLLLSRTDCLRVTGPVFAVVCFGILGGNLITTAVGSVPGYVIGTANLVLTLAIFIYEIFIRKFGQEADRVEENLLPVLDNGSTPVSVCSVLTSAMQKRLSPKEGEVLECVIQGKTFKETAEVLSLSESSVKTYMKRIYEKMGVTGKKELITALANDGKPV